ncbi:TonB-dependent receptor [Glaciecola sp.]|nr:TonB-dependent receptor [Glaciecola sp.]
MKIISNEQMGLPITRLCIQSNTRAIFLLMGLWGCMISLLVNAQDAVYTQSDRWQVNGFAAQGMVQTNHSSYINETNKLSFRVTEIGLNSRFKINDSWSLAGQIVYLDVGNRYAKGGRVDYAFVDWEPNLFDDANWSFKAQVGRVKNNHWLYSSTRDVPHTRLSTILPQSVYFDGFRDVALGSDGVALQIVHLSTLGTWQYKWSYGASPINNAQRDQLFSPLAKGKLSQDYTHQLSVYFAPNNTNIEVGLSVLDSDFSYAANVAGNDPFVNGSATSQRVMLHGQYFAENWELAAEIMRERGVFKDALFTGFSSDQFGDGGYVQGRYLLNPKHSVIARIDLYDMNENDRSGKRIPLQTQGVVPEYFTYMDQATLGWQWHIAEQWQLQTDVHLIKGTGRLTPILFPDPVLNPNKYWTMWSMQLMYWF